jgi:hypothetical protein
LSSFLFVLFRLRFALRPSPVAEISPKQTTALVAPRSCVVIPDVDFNVLDALAWCFFAVASVFVLCCLSGLFRLFVCVVYYFVCYIAV